MAQITKPIEMPGILNTILGVGPRSDGFYYLKDLCTSPNINMWAKYKPVVSQAVHELSESERNALAYGLTWDGLGLGVSHFGYNRQTASNSMHRMLDFASPLDDVSGTRYSGYDSNITSPRFGMASSMHTTGVTLDNVATGELRMQLGGGYGTPYIGLWDLKDTLFANMHYVRLQCVSQGGYGNVTIYPNTINLNDFVQGSGYFSFPYRTLIKLGKPGSSEPSEYKHLKSFLSSNVAGATTLEVGDSANLWFSVTIGCAKFTSWDTAVATRQSNIKVGTVAASSSMQTCAYYCEVPSGSPRYLDLTSATKFFIWPNGLGGGGTNITLDRSNTYLRITNWDTKKEGYVVLGSGESLDAYWSISPTQGGTIQSLGQLVSALPNLGTGMFGFSLVYRVPSAGSDIWMPITAEVYARCKFPTTSVQPTDIF